jgi:3-oxoacyl-(acyl-carrier-protein) synthase
MGIVSPLGKGLDKTLSAIKQATRAVNPLQLFSTTQKPLPVGEIDFINSADDIPRTHVLAMIAAEEAMQNVDEPPDAVIIGVTTGGMTMTEELLKRGEKDPLCYRHHSTGTIAEAIACRFGCRGPVLTVSTACSSGPVALKLAMEMLRSGHARRVLAGGVDALCRLTYYGFHSLQLVDPTGAHPFDRSRRGMTVGEGAAMLLLSAAETPPPDALAEFLGGGLSCDAYHPAAPHPEGEGALRAMEEALTDAGITAKEIDYIHLHGTGTADNDRAEASAIHNLFGDQPLPFVSSLKGAHGHALAAAGAMGAVVSVLCLRHGLIPANVGFMEPDPLLNLVPVDKLRAARVHKVLTNAFGFGGNNAVLVFGAPFGNDPVCPDIDDWRPAPFFVHGRACLSDAGGTAQTLARLRDGGHVRGTVSGEDILKPLSEKAVRRLKRLPRLVLSLVISACETIPESATPRAVFFGTGWGGLSETHDFLKKLFTSGERFTSPTDFIGSVHNAPAGQAAIHFQATGPNITTTGGECAFEQALFCADLLGRDEPILLVGADEYHDILSPLFDASVILEGPPTDGGGALYLTRQKSGASCQVVPAFMAYTGTDGPFISEMVSALGGSDRIRDRYGLVLAGIPAAQREKGKNQMEAFLSLTGFPHPVVDYRRFLGEFASASAVATVLAVQLVEGGDASGVFCGQDFCPLEGRGILVLGFGHQMTALEVSPC